MLVTVKQRVPFQQNLSTTDRSISVENMNWEAKKLRSVPMRDIFVEIWNVRYPGLATDLDNSALWTRWCAVCTMHLPRPIPRFLTQS